MKKKIICLLVVLMLAVCAIGLSACDLFGGNDGNGTQTEQPDGNANKFDDNASSGQKAPKLSYLYKFDISALQFSDMMYPSEETADNADLAVKYEEYLWKLQEYQLYVNEINAKYTGSQFAFYDNNTAVLTFADGSTANYLYRKTSEYDSETRTTIYYIDILTIEDGKYVIELYAVLDEEVMLFSTQMDDDGMFNMYLQFVVSK